MSYRFEVVDEVPLGLGKFEIDKTIPSIGDIVAIPQLMETIFGYKKCYIIFYEGLNLQAVILGSIIKNKFISHPHLSYGGVFMTQDFSLDNYNLGSTFSNVEIRSFSKISQFSKSEKLTSILPLNTSIESQLASFKYNVRRQIKIANKNGLICCSGSLNLMEDFYSVYTDNMHRLGSPPQPISFFRGLLEFWKNEEAMIFCVYRDGTPVSAAFTLRNGIVLESCWAGSLVKYNKFYPTYLMYWAMIEYSVSKGLKYFSFGRSSYDSGPLRFKNHWKPDSVAIYSNYLRKPGHSLKKLKFMNLVLKRTPKFFIMFLGRVFTKYIY